MGAISENKFNLGEENIRVKVEYDDGDLNPRTDFDGNASEMICFHSRYSLGDEHSYSSPEGFLVSIIEEHLSDEQKEVLLKPFFEKHYPNIRVEEDVEDESFDIIYDYKSIDGTVSDCRYASYKVSDVENFKEEIEDAKHEILLDFINNEIEDAMTISELLEIVESIENIVILPLYLYDHSGITINTTGFSCSWDSGQVGWIYNSIEAYKKETDNNHTKEQIKEDFTSQVEMYDKYIRGTILWYIVEKENKCDCCGHIEYEELDSCGGFFDSESLIDYVLENIEEKHKDEVRKTLEKELQYV